MSQSNANFIDYVKAAFSARPVGMFVPPNWIMLAAFGLLSFLNVGFLFIGAGLELAYLLGLASSGRFQKWVQADLLSGTQKTAEQKVQSMLSRLPWPDQERFRQLSRRCETVLKQQSIQDGGGAIISAQSEGLSRLVWIYLRLLITRQQIQTVLQTGVGQPDESIDVKIERLSRQKASDKIGDDLRRSIEGQIDILEQRKKAQADAKNKIVFIEAELTRISEQVELIREQAAIAADASDVSARIDAIGSTLNSTTEWISTQQDLYGKIDDVVDPPTLIVGQK